MLARIQGVNLGGSEYAYTLIEYLGYPLAWELLLGASVLLKMWHGEVCSVGFYVYISL